MVVKTNMKYMVVASFAIQRETTVAISEALAILKTWNPNWNPRVFMVDNCEEEINSLETTFPG